MGVVSDIERQLGRLRAREDDDGMPELRTSTMTHIVWCPPEWRAKARATLAGLLERHPARTIFLIPCPGSEATIDTRVELKDFQLQGLSREVLSEVIELRLRGSAAQHPGSIVLPLLVSDLPVFCRWRGEPGWGSVPLAEIVGVTDRLVVDSSEWRDVPEGLSRGSRSCSTASPSRTSRSRARCRGGAGSPSSGRRSGAIEKLRVEGPRADAELVAGWLRSRLKRDDRADAAERSRGEGDVGRRRARRVAGRAAQRERAPLRRARSVRPQRGLRGCGPGRRLAARP